MSQENGGSMEDNQPSKKINCMKIARHLDLFAFMPVPKTNLVQSKRSLYGSLIMICLFFAYMIFGFVSFLIKNAPRVNMYTQILPSDNILTPEIAFAFFYGDPFTSTVNNASIFTFQFQQVTKYRDVSINSTTVTIPLVSCSPSWLPDQGFPMLCPNQSTNMSGALYQTPIYTYPRIQVTYCNPTKLSCISQTDLYQITAGGRILMFVKDNSPNFDMTTGKTITTIPYQTFQFFLIPGLYPRAQVQFLAQKYTIHPDYFTRFTNDIRQYLSVESVDTYATNVTVYNPYSAYQIFFQVDQTETLGFLTYATILDMVSLWGAFWGVLFSTFAAYFLSYNQQNFYSNNKDWENFGQKLEVKKAKDTLFDEEDDIEASKKDTSSKNSIVFEMGNINTSKTN